MPPQLRAEASPVRSRRTSRPAKQRHTTFVVAEARTPGEALPTEARLGGKDGRWHVRRRSPLEHQLGGPGQQNDTPQPLRCHHRPNRARTTPAVPQQNRGMPAVLARHQTIAECCQCTSCQGGAAPLFEECPSTKTHPRHQRTSVPRTWKRPSPSCLTQADTHWGHFPSSSSWANTLPAPS